VKTAVAGKGWISAAKGVYTAAF